MYGNNREDILSKQVEYSFISLNSSKIRIGVIGGGRAGEIKTKHFVKDKCQVYVLSKEFSEDLIELEKQKPKYLHLIKDDFTYEFLKDKHIIIIAVNNEELSNNIRKYCDDNSKIYIDSTDFTKGMGVVPTVRKTDNINFALSTNGGNPKGSVFVCNKAIEALKDYDEFIRITTIIRNNAKCLEKYKNEIFNVIYTDEFLDSVNNNTYKEYLKTFFADEIVEKIIKI